MKLKTEKEQIRRVCSRVLDRVKNSRQKFSIYSRLLEKFSARVEIFNIIAIYFSSLYRVEISARDENLRAISYCYCIVIIQIDQTCWIFKMVISDKNIYILRKKWLFGLCISIEFILVIYTSFCLRDIYSKLLKVFIRDFRGNHVKSG